jgi:hypothetical protein
MKQADLVEVTACASFLQVDLVEVTACASFLQVDRFTLEQSRQVADHFPSR